MLSKLMNPEWSVATDDDSSIVACKIPNFAILLGEVSLKKTTLDNPPLLKLQMINPPSPRLWRT
jgi:hypothetical protein